MQTIRAALFVVILSLLTIGYGASQWDWLTGNFAAYAKRVDVPPVQHLALGALVVTVLSALIWPKEDRVKETES